MRVLVLSPVTLETPRSISFATVQLVQSIANLGHQVDVLCCQQGSTLLSRSTTGNLATDCAYAIRRWRAHSMLLRQWLHYPPRSQVQLIHSIDSTVVPAAMCQMLFGIPFVHSMFNAQSDEYDVSRQSHFNRASGWESWASARSLGVFVHCQSLAELAARRNPNLPIIRSDLTRVDSTESNRTQSIENWPTTGEQVVMYVGEIGRDQRLLLDAFTYLVHYQANVKLILIGGSLHDIRIGQARAKTLGIANRVSFLGQIPADSIVDYLRQATILVAASTGGQHVPLKIYSYLAAGRPIVATRIRAYTQLLHSGRACFVEPTALDLYLGMRKLLADAPLRRDMSARTLLAAQATARLPSARFGLAELYEKIDDRITRDAAST